MAKFLFDLLRRNKRLPGILHISAYISSDAPHRAVNIAIDVSTNLSFDKSCCNNTVLRESHVFAHIDPQKTQVNDIATGSVNSPQKMVWEASPHDSI